MALGECGDCGRIVDLNAKSCAACGARFGAKKPDPAPDPPKAPTPPALPELRRKTSSPLAECEACGRMVSLKAPACPGCGLPFGALPSIPQGAPVVIEQTAKFWKAGMLIGGVTWAMALPSCISGSNNGGAIAAIGSLVWLVSRILGWWHHG